MTQVARAKLESGPPLGEEPTVSLTAHNSHDRTQKFATDGKTQNDIFYKNSSYATTQNVVEKPPGNFHNSLGLSAMRR